MKNNGFKNEKNFVKFFNNKYLSEFDKNTQELLKEIFDNVIDDSMPIISWKNNLPQKADIFIKFKKYVKSISIKSGTGNSVHQEKLHDFEEFLKSLYVPYYAIDNYISFHFGYARDKNGSRITSQKLGTFEYLRFFQKEIDNLNKYINKTRTIVSIVDRIIIRGRNSEYGIDALISGTPQNYVWINKDDIYDLFLSKKLINYNVLHVSLVTFGPKIRHSHEDKTKKEILNVTFRWKEPRKDIIEYKRKKYINNF